MPRHSASTAASSTLATVSASNFPKETLDISTYWIRIPPDIHDALTYLRTQRHINTSAWVRATIKIALEGEGLLSDTASAPTVSAPPPVRGAPLPAGVPSAWTTGTGAPSTSVIPPRCLLSSSAPHHLTVQLKNGQSWATIVTAVLERSSEQVIVTDSGRPATP